MSLIGGRAEHGSHVFIPARAFTHGTFRIPGVGGGGRCSKFVTDLSDHIFLGSSIRDAGVGETHEIPV